jgi:hypothetical protein
MSGHKDDTHALTVACPDDEMVKGSGYGPVTWMEWCLMEVARMRRVGADVRLGRGRGKCWVTRV